MAYIESAAKFGDDAVIGSIMDGTITEYIDSAVESIRSYVFSGCNKLEIVDIPSVKSIGGGAFNRCTSLLALILRRTTMSTLGSAALTGTPIASGTGYIYVPAALVDSYKTATNWSTYADQFRALEDYTVDGTVTGDLDETKI